MRIIGQDRAGVLLLVLVIGAITIALQSWLGDITIYSKDLEQKRLELHYSILTNKAPPGGWAAAGGTTTNVRIGVVALAEGVRKMTGLQLRQVYKLLDSVFLFAALVGFFFYLRKWLPDVYCLIGVLYCCAVLPLTYFLYYFHPWDRIQLAIWVLLLYLIREGRPVLLAFCLAISTVVKFDAIVLPALYFLVHVSWDRWRRISVETVGLFATVLAVLAGLSWLFPAPVESQTLFWKGPSHIVPYNIEVIRSMNVRYPPLLASGVPVLLAVFGIFRPRERCAWASALFGLGLLVVFFGFSKFEEVRAHFMVLFLLLPTALLSLQCLLERRSAPTPQA